MSGTVYRFITKNTGGSCGTNCPKRVTVAVTINSGAGNKPDPVTASTVVSEAQDQNADENAAEPPPPPGPSYVTFYPTDTKAAPPLPGTRVEPSASHVVHESDKFPDLMVTDPPPNPSAPASPPLYKFSNPLDVYTAQEFPGGRIIRKESNCDNVGDKNKVHWWVTKPLPTTVTLTGKFIGSVYTQVLGQVPGNVILCATVYKVTNPAQGDWRVRWWSTPSSTEMTARARCSGSGAIPSHTRRAPATRSSRGWCRGPASSSSATPSSTRSARTSALRSRCP